MSTRRDSETPSETLERYRRDAADGWNKTTETSTLAVEDTNTIGIGDLNENVTQQIVTQILRERDDMEAETPTKILGTMLDGRSESEAPNLAADERSGELESSISKSTDSTILSSAKTEPLVTKAAQQEDDLEDGIETTFATEPKHSEEKKQIAGLMFGSMEKRIALILVWISPGIGAFLGALPTMWLLKLIGERKLFAGSLFVSSFATFCLAFMMADEWNYFAIAALRYIQGMAFSTTFPIIGSLSANWATLKEQFCFLAWNIFFVEMAPILSWPLCWLLAEHNYKLCYILQASITLGIALIWLIFYRDRAQYHPWVNGLELNKIVTGKVRAINSRTLEDQPFNVLLKSARVWAIWMAAFGFFIIFAFLAQFLPIFLHTTLNLSANEAIQMAIFPFGAFIVVYIILYGVWNLANRICCSNQWLSMVISSSFAFTTVALLLILTAIVPALTIGTIRLTILFTLMVLFGTISVFAFGRSAVLVGRYFTQHIVANFQPFIGLAMLLTSTVTVLTVQSSSSYEWRLVLLMMAALALICAVIFGFLGEDKAEEWAKESWDPSAARRMISIDQIDYHHDECGIVEMRLLNQHNH